MPTLTWTDKLALGLPEMDTTHREFVELLAHARRCDAESLPAAWRALVEHTDAHFAREEKWMHDSRFHACQCHAAQHKVVLRVLHEGQMLADRGDIVPVRAMIEELALWFPQHAQTMDAALAEHLLARQATAAA
ncbi:bacteriohemerythrin [Ramlibacter albus]|uniref:Hemerythrin domain-containing protein n=1 Tax=Ramlibacter albus TaxID=2079448 RepID=A0A923M982_9BURK|nr:hemerythrin domain-containing protein [Ramlibacter albus]MBC5766006.1 hemerythrin domain-containing protein [Ramlibacter albus]